MTSHLEEIIEDLKFEAHCADQDGQYASSELFHNAAQYLVLLEEAKEIIEYAEKMFSYQPDLQLTDSEGRGDGELNEISLKINKFKNKLDEQEQ